LKDAVHANPVLAHCETNENLKFYSDKIAYMSYDTYFTVLKMTAMANDKCISGQIRQNFQIIPIAIMLDLRMRVEITLTLEINRVLTF
jgi:hypothetical protein